ncbi:hypothetical protein [Thiocystis violacea]|uniref:hypothetical protein n=1 Tax=Thiocystis violacea TaxID=13725 RepID=UPI001905009D|nr:hypothetical protein [Thiocystis violacea]
MRVAHPSGKCRHKDKTLKNSNYLRSSRFNHKFQVERSQEANSAGLIEESSEMDAGGDWVAWPARSEVLKA